MTQAVSWRLKPSPDKFLWTRLHSVRLLVLHLTLFSYPTLLAGTLIWWHYRISHSDLWNTCESKALYVPLQVLDSLFLYPWCPVVHFEAPQQFGFRVWAPSPTCHSNSNLVFPWIEIKMHTSFDSCILLLPCPLQTLQSCNNKPSCRLYLDSPANHIWSCWLICLLSTPPSRSHPHPHLHWIFFFKPFETDLQSRMI